MKNIKDKLDKISRILFNIYIKHNRKKGPVYISGSQYIKELGALSPGKDVKRVAEAYYIKKISNSIIIIFFSVIIAILSVVSQSESGSIKEDNKVARKESGEGTYNLSLQAKTSEYDYGNLTIDIEERTLTKAEYESMICAVATVMDNEILGENQEFGHIDTDLNLINGVEGYPCSIRWETSDYMLLHNDGKFGDVCADEEGNDITVRGIIAYREQEYVKEYALRIYPHRMTDDQLKQAKLLNAVKSENDKTKELNYLRLPTEIDGMEILWTEKNPPILLIIFIGMLVVIAAIWIGTDRDLLKKYEERKQSLLVEYSEFVSKLQLLLNSGLTIRGALERMADQYKKYIREGGKNKYAYEELLLCIKKLQDGMSEAECYEYLGNRCGLAEYRKLSSLLIQNLRKGNEGLIASLAHESKNAFETRKAAAKRMGEEAQTKLLFPMVLMLTVVMIIIMIPAYMSFGM